jgi:hypothetical protein
MTGRPESPYEAAARVADNWATRALIPECLFFAEQIAREIRALPQPPERALPAFTGEEIFEHSVGTGLSWSQRIADYINTRIAASGFAQGGPVDLEKMQEAREESYNRGYKNGRQDTALLSEAAIQARIDAAVLAERQSCAEAVTRMRVPPEMASQSTLLQIALGVLRREENSDDAGDPINFSEGLEWLSIE